ncbi:ribosomal protein S18-alanine N-acetyltransferase [Paenibacillus crassostreae]|uniref:Ribosomal-protein-alanine acetyltransferase n=1 Tax=Paenibacillus crassostreae TaxID=1763538 RepID=A0A167AHC3_9BACL|nr:ribosomal protein S18-alanine N-acetyltransferase [Paenibacillus crassostreae]AOZ92304.1 ribosomal-protein-alanine N-acetyltransferase [Paenibacillus crassostreae]OAB71021.1 ribosomal-protein-alanine acetyltransferase [Paenibacillus crassostreae]
MITEQFNKQEYEDISFRAMKLEDVPAIMIIEHEAFTLPWTETAFHNELTNNHFAKYIVMENNGLPVGYAGMWTIVDEAHITNIAILEEYRGRKLGDRLLDELIKTAYQSGMERMTLEVRVSNRIAQRLYAKKGFKAAGIRKGYYSDNHEDAMIMWAELPRNKEYGSWEGSV